VLTDLQNLIVHACWQIGLTIVAVVIESELDPLITKIDKLITFVERMDK
jgi:hypothetical protein